MIRDFLCISTKPKFCLQVRTKTLQNTCTSLSHDNSRYLQNMQKVNMKLVGTEVNRVHTFFQKQNNFRDISRTFPGLRLNFPGLLNSKFSPFTPKISMLILLTFCHTFHIFYLSSTDFQNSAGPAAFFQDFQSWKMPQYM